MRTVPVDDPLAVDVVGAIHRGDVQLLAALLTEHPWLATARIGDPEGSGGTSRSLLHVVTDWPGHFPRGADVVRTLVAAGADPDARFLGPHVETPLHWAASSDDVEVLDALLDAGADIDATGAVIAGGTALTDAAAFGQWRAARRLLDRGASVQFWEAATLGVVDIVQARLLGSPSPAHDEVTGALWGACHGGQRATAALLLAAGADPAWVGWDGLTPIQAARRSGFDDVADWVAARAAR